LELGRALERDVRVIPVLVGRAHLPATTELPEELRGLVQRQAVTLHDETWHDDVNGLIRSLRGEPAVPATPSRRRWELVGGVVVVLALVAAGLVWFGGWRNADDDGEADPAPCPDPGGDAWHRIELADDPTGGVEIEEGSLEFRVQAAQSRELESGAWQVILDTSMENQTPGPHRHGYWYYDALVVGQRAFNTQKCFSPDEGQEEGVAPDTVGDARVGFEVRCPPEGYIYLQLSAEEGADTIDVTSETLEPSTAEPADACHRERACRPPRELEICGAVRPWRHTCQSGCIWLAGWTLVWRGGTETAVVMSPRRRPTGRCLMRSPGCTAITALQRSSGRRQEPSLGRRASPAGPCRGTFDIGQ
jgi:hypothetical protein